MPTRNARNGTLFTSKGRIVIKNAKYADDFSVLDENCTCKTCKYYTRAYLRHIFMAKEILSYNLNTIHNLTYYVNIIKRIRAAILNDGLNELKKELLEEYNTDNEELGG
jgi:queuine tRNA-ribosyltransferase